MGTEEVNAEQVKIASFITDGTGVTFDPQLPVTPNSIKS